MSLFILVLSAFSIGAESTDIAAAYKHGILLLRNASFNTKSILDASPLFLNLSQDLPFPIGLAHDSLSGDFFVSEYTDYDSEIYSFKLGDNGTTTPLKEEILKSRTSVIESISYDQESKHLFWTDSLNDRICNASIETVSSDMYCVNLLYPSFSHNDVEKPRGIAIDFCNRFVYWTELNSQKRTIKQYNMRSQELRTIKEYGEGVPGYFQGIHYDAYTGNLIWAETETTLVNATSCSFFQKANSKEEEKLTMIDNCHPFSITSDDNYIYWSDWAREGVMRLSKTNVNELVKLVHTPEYTDGTTTRLVYGLVNLNKLNIEDVCRNNIEDSNIKSKTNLELKESVTIQSALKQVEDNPIVGNHADLEVNNDNPDELLNQDSDPVSTSANTEEIEEVFSPVFSSASRISMSSRTYNHLHIIIIALAIICLFFMISTLLLLNYTVTTHQKHLGSVRSLFCGHNVTKTLSAPISPPNRKIPKRFGSKSRMSLKDKSLCNMNDGISLEIEDCCQMTLCDRPCYTTMSKEGKGYITSKANRCEDKQILLDDSEFA